MRIENLSQLIRLVGAVSFIVSSVLYVMGATSVNWVHFAEAGHAGLFEECGVLYNISEASLNGTNITTERPVTTDDSDSSQENGTEKCERILVGYAQDYLNATRFLVILGGLFLAFGLFTLKREMCDNLGEEQYRGKPCKLLLTALVPIAGACLGRLGLWHYSQHYSSDTKYPEATLAWSYNVLMTAVHMIPFAIFLRYAPVVSRLFSLEQLCEGIFARPFNKVATFFGCQEWHFTRGEESSHGGGYHHNFQGSRDDQDMQLGSNSFPAPQLPPSYEEVMAEGSSVLPPHDTLQPSSSTTCPPLPGAWTTLQPGYNAPQQPSARSRDTPLLPACSPPSYEDSVTRTA